MRSSRTGGLTAAALAAAITACHSHAPPAVPARAPEADAPVPADATAAPESPFLLGMQSPPQSRRLPWDRGPAALQRLLVKLQSSHSVLFVTAHPDDEQAGTLTALGRGSPARTALLSLTRGESGANAMGPEVFEALGLVRTEELLLAARHYGLDDLYFGPLFDFGFSKQLDEALEQWGRERAVESIVRVIRLNRPDVVVSRFEGSPRDGHGHHQASGAVVREAFEAAGDPSRFPEHLRAGLRAWRPARLFVAGDADEPAQARVEPQQFSPWLGMSYRELGWLGWSLQRTQTAGRGRELAGSPIDVFRLLSPAPPPPQAPSDADPADLFEGLASRLPSPVAAAAAHALETFDPRHPQAVAPLLARGLALTRSERAKAEASGDVELAFVLALEERRFAAALTEALGLAFSATALPEQAVWPRSPFEPLPALGPVAPGSRFRVEPRLQDASEGAVRVGRLALEAPAGWSIEPRPNLEAGGAPAAEALPFAGWTVSVPADAQTSRPYFSRASVRQAWYDLDDPRWYPLPLAPQAVVAAAELELEGVRFTMRAPVETLEEVFPDGFAGRPLEILPAVSVAVAPGVSFAPRAASSMDLQVALLSSSAAAETGEVRLRMPAGWSSDPVMLPFELAPGEARRLAFRVKAAPASTGDEWIEAFATSRGGTFSVGYTRVGYKGLPAHWIPARARGRVQRVDFSVAPKLAVGYVAGAGDDIPQALATLGATVFPLAERELASRDLSDLDAVVVGVRAYAVRPDLKAHNRRLLDYARAGGHLLVLYQTPEFDPRRDAPLPATLPADPEETAEEDAPVEWLAPAHPLMRWPNAITRDDFAGWVEQRGSKFWSDWDPAYVPLVSTHDRGQPPQAGTWLSARVGRGHYTYCALAFHRQLPQAVPGAVRLFANLISLKRAPAASWQAWQKETKKP